MIKLGEILDHEGEIYEIGAYDKQNKLCLCYPITVADDGRKITGDTGISLTVKETKERIKKYKKWLKENKKH